MENRDGEIGFVYNLFLPALLVYNMRVRSKMMGVPDDDRRAFFYSVFFCPTSLVW